MERKKRGLGLKNSKTNNRPQFIGGSVEQLAQATKLLTSIRKVSGSNLGQRHMNIINRHFYVVFNFCCN
jgi:hypothetical protein